MDAWAKSLPLFKGMPSAARANLLKDAIFHAVPPGTILFEQGQSPTFQHVVLAGSVALFGRSSEGREVLVERVNPPDLVIPAAVMADEPYLMEARIQEPTQILLIHAVSLRTAMAHNPALAKNMIASLSEQFRRMVRQIKNLKLRSASQRVGCYILMLSRSQGGQNEVVLPYEKNLIASELGMTRESFSRALAELQTSGIEVRGDRIAISNLGRLVNVCKPDPLIDPDEQIQLPSAPDQMTSRRMAR
jgi:CRP/FNR family transcriptional activator FtrB